MLRARTPKYVFQERLGFLTTKLMFFPPKKEITSVSGLSGQEQAYFNMLYSYFMPRSPGLIKKLRLFWLDFYSNQGLNSTMYKKVQQKKILVYDIGFLEPHNQFSFLYSKIITNNMNLRIKW